MPRIPAASVLVIILAAAGLTQTSAQSSNGARRTLRSGDLYRIRGVSDPQISPDGAWVAYTVSTIDSAKDKNDTDVWMVSWDGVQSVRLTSSPESESSPRWSPDGRYLAFLSGRQESHGAQVWLMDRRGGEAQRITELQNGVSDYAWSPDSKRLVLVVDDETDSLAKRDTGATKTPKPIVVDRYHFRQDVRGFLGTKRSHFSLFDIAAKKAETITSGMDEDNSPSWSPDGMHIAFIRRSLPEPTRVESSHVWVVEAHASALPKQLTDFVGPDGGRPAWSPDGKWLAFTRGDEPKFSAYHENRLAVVRSDGSAPARMVTAAYDRPVSQPRFDGDENTVLATVSDDRAQHVVRIRVDDGAVEPVVAGKLLVSGFSGSGGGEGKLAVVAATPERPNEIFAVPPSGAGGQLRQLSHQNDSLFSELQLGTTRDFTSHSSDGTEVHGLLLEPANAAPGVRRPLILYVHGGPNGQDGYGFNYDGQFFAASGYVVLAVNYRGSSGRGSAYQKAIFADWGHKEVQDLIGAVDEAVREGIADPDRMGIGGWSYGGILTDYTIATTPRFRAAVSGAGSALQLSMYGTDQYIEQYNLELGPPWKSQDLWLKLSYPFFHADRIKTPTLFMGGESDSNVPIIGGEQMYQALRTTGVPTQLVVYPGQFHGLTTPSYRKDRLERYLAWYDRWLKGQVAQAGQH